MDSLKQLLIALVLVVSVMGLVGWEENGSAEKAGEQLDKSMEDAAKKANELLGKQKRLFIVTKAVREKRKGLSQMAKPFYINPD